MTTMMKSIVVILSMMVLVLAGQMDNYGGYVVVMVSMVVLVLSGQVKILHHNYGGDPPLDVCLWWSDTHGQGKRLEIARSSLRNFCIIKNRLTFRPRWSISISHI